MQSLIFKHGLFDFKQWHSSHTLKCNYKEEEKDVEKSQIDPTTPWLLSVDSTPAQQPLFYGYIHCIGKTLFDKIVFLFIPIYNKYREKT